MEVTNVINHHTPAMRALRRVAGSSDRPAAPWERSGEDVGIPAPLCKEGADRRQRDTRERPGRELDREDRPRPFLRAGAGDDHNAGAPAYGLLTVRHVAVVSIQLARLAPLRSV